MEIINSILISDIENLQIRYVQKIAYLADKLVNSESTKEQQLIIIKELGLYKQAYINSRELRAMIPQ